MISTQRLFMLVNIVGFGTLILHWLLFRGIMGFFLVLFMMCLALLRWRFPATKWTIVLDVAACAAISPLALILAMFSAFYYGMYIAVGIAVLIMLTSLLEMGGIMLLPVINMQMSMMAILGGIAGLFLGLWEKDHEKELKTRDEETGRYYQMESLQSDLMTATAQIERMTVVSERARISREIHDNAGHEIVAAYMSLQTARMAFSEAAIDPDALSLYDAALERLDKGANKIREAVHNLAPVTTLGVETLQETCKRFPNQVDFKTFGNTTHIPVHVWGVLESCLNETLTNAARHASPKKVEVTLDATPHIVRLCVENDGLLNQSKIAGNGLRNMRHRATAAGGSLTVSTGDVFRVICVIPVSADICNILDKDIDKL